jgi:hypothetical protein
MAKPYLYFCGATPFNGELLEAEHLMIEDDIANTDFRSRRNFGNRIKQIAANEGQVCHAKHKQALTLNPFWRITVSCNDEAENMMILPPMDPSLSDKLMLLKVAKAPMPMPTRTDNERRAFREAIASELPHYLDFLRKMEIPPEIRGNRFGVLTYQNPELLCCLNELSPEFQLLELIDSHLDFKEGKRRGLASELQADIEVLAPGNQTRNLFSYAGACGALLSHLVNKMPERVRSTKSKGKTYYTILAPEGHDVLPEAGNITKFPSVKFQDGDAQETGNNYSKN